MCSTRAAAERRSSILLPSDTLIQVHGSGDRHYSPDVAVADSGCSSTRRESRFPSLTGHQLQSVSFPYSYSPHGHQTVQDASRFSHEAVDEWEMQWAGQARLLPSSPIQTFSCA